MQNWIVLACVFGWCCFVLFGYLLLANLMNSAQTAALIAGELALYGLAVGCMTSGHLKSWVRTRMKVQIRND